MVKLESLFALAGSEPLPLVTGPCRSEEARKLLASTSARELFSGAYSPEGALAGLWLRFSCFDESHSVSQNLHTPEGSLWHGILHRQEPDSGNARYWFGQAGRHPIFPNLREAAAQILAQQGLAHNLKPEWDPFAFIDMCEQARRQPRSAAEQAAREIQMAEWRLLFEYCSRPSA